MEECKPRRMVGLGPLQLSGSRSKRGASWHPFFSLFRPGDTRNYARMSRSKQAKKLYNNGMTFLRCPGIGGKDG